MDGTGSYRAATADASAPFHIRTPRSSARPGWVGRCCLAAAGLMGGWLPLIIGLAEVISACSHNGLGFSMLEPMGVLVGAMPVWG